MKKLLTYQREDLAKIDAFGGRSLLGWGYGVGQDLHVAHMGKAAGLARRCRLSRQRKTPVGTGSPGTGLDGGGLRRANPAGDKTP